MSSEYFIVLLIIVLITVLALGLPLCFALGGVAMIFTWFVWGTEGFFSAAMQGLTQSTSEILLAVPMFVFMGNLLKNSAIADEIYDMMYHTLGSVKGGLAVGTVFVCTIFAAMAGISAVATITMGMIALPSMLKHGYDKHLALGCIASAGGLGILIPPSVTMILYALLAQLSVGKLFAAGMVPGIVLAALYSIYIFTRSYMNPQCAPALPREEWPTFIQVLKSFKALVWPLIIIFLVLGTIYGGICTPTEASGVGAFGTLLAVIVKRKFTWKSFREACYQSLIITCMVMWIVIGSACFSTIFNYMGAQEIITSIVLEMPGGPWAVYIIFQIVFFMLGCLLDPTAIVMICTPVFHPIAVQLGFDPIFFAVTFIINMQMAYITPPFGYNLFYLRSIVPPNITMRDIYVSVVPYIAVIIVCLVLVSIFPDLVIWLPNKLIH